MLHQVDEPGRLSHDACFESNDPVVGRGTSGEMGDRGLLEHGSLGGVQVLDDRCQDPGRRLLRLARGLAGTFDRGEDFEERDLLGGPGQPVSPRRPPSAIDEAGPFELDQYLDQITLRDAVRLRDLPDSHRRAVETLPCQGDDCQARIFGLRRQFHGSLGVVP